jgi:transcriptional regulator with XRE-family HTH domain
MTDSDDEQGTGTDRNAAIFAEAFGRIIQEERKRQGLRQDELALHSGTGKRFIVDLEAGKSSCQLGRTLLVANKLGLNLVDILRQVRTNRPPQPNDAGIDIPDSDEEPDAPPVPGGPR